MGRTKELFGQMREQGMDIDCNGNLYEEWLREEPRLGAEHSVIIPKEAKMNSIQRTYIMHHDMQVTAERLGFNVASKDSERLKNLSKSQMTDSEIEEVENYLNENGKN